MAPQGRCWSVEEMTIVYGVLDEHRATKNYDCRSICLGIHELVPAVRSPTDPVITYKQVYNKLVNVARRSDLNVQDFLRRGLPLPTASFSEEDRTKATFALFAARSKLMRSIDLTSPTSTASVKTVNTEPDLRSSSMVCEPATAGVNARHGSEPLSLISSRTIHQKERHRLHPKRGLQSKSVTLTDTRVRLDLASRHGDETLDEARHDTNRRVADSSTTKRKDNPSDVCGTETGLTTRSKTRRTNEDKTSAPRSRGRPSIWSISKSPTTPTTERHSNDQIRIVSDTGASNNRLEKMLGGLELDECEVRMIVGLRNAQSHQGANNPPTAYHVIKVFDDIDDRIAKAVQSYVRSKSCVGLTVNKLSSDTILLCQTFLPSCPTGNVSRLLETFLGYPGASTEQVLRVIAMAAIVKFVIVDDGEVFKRKQTDEADAAGWSFFRQYNPAAYDKFQRIANLKYLEKVVAPNLPKLAAQLTGRLTDVFNDFRKPGHAYANCSMPSETSKPAGIPLAHHFREENFSAWQEAMGTVLKKALQLRLEIACSPYSYDYEYPKYSDAFDETTMEVSQEQARTQAGDAVWACVRPLIRSWDGAPQDGPCRILTRARVILE